MLRFIPVTVLLFLAISLSLFSPALSNTTTKPYILTFDLSISSATKDKVVSFLESWSGVNIKTVFDYSVFKGLLFEVPVGGDLVAQGGSGKTETIEGLKDQLVKAFEGVIAVEEDQEVHTMGRELV